jgi:hypothetical protein
MKSESDPQQGADLLMHIKVRPVEAKRGLNHDIKLLHTEPCNLCGGQGKIRGEKCHNCHGSGHVIVKRTIEVHIPSGVKNGMRLRLKGLGEAGDYGGENGDLFIEVHFQPYFESLLERTFNFLKDLLFEDDEDGILPEKMPPKTHSDGTIIKNNFIETKEEVPCSFELEDMVKCSGCGRTFRKKELIQCGPCFEHHGGKKLFCKKCWKKHQWSHGKPWSIESWY